jgi:hypothetical protein
MHPAEMDVNLNGSNPSPRPTLSSKSAISVDAGRPAVSALGVNAETLIVGLIGTFIRAVIALVGVYFRPVVAGMTDAILWPSSRAADGSDERSLLWRLSTHELRR